MPTSGHRSILAGAAILVLTTAVIAQEVTSGAQGASALDPLRGSVASSLGGSGLHLDLAAAASQPEVDQSGGATPEPDRIPFGRAGSEWLIIGGGYAWDFYIEDDYNAHVAYACFLGDELEMAVEVGGWYFDPHGDNAFGVNGNLMFRWHFWHDADYDWTVYGDIGIGLLAASDNVPDGGTGVDFTPRAGFGLTRRITDDGLRLQVGLRWHHISNGRIAGDDRNPSRDSLMGYFGIMIPF